MEQALHLILAFMCSELYASICTYVLYVIHKVLNEDKTLKHYAGSAQQR